jgi:hypothetical protein
VKCYESVCGPHRHSRNFAILRSTFAMAEPNLANRVIRDANDCDQTPSTNQLLMLLAADNRRLVGASRFFVPV